MSMRKRTPRRFEVEALEGRLAPGGGASGIGGELLQAHVAAPEGGMSGEFAPIPCGGRVGGSGEVAPTPCGGRTGIGGEV
jgi:hypothetical protein